MVDNILVYKEEKKKFNSLQMSITVQSRAWTEGKIRGNLCVLANNRTGHQTRRIIARRGTPLALSASPPRALTLWPQYFKS